MTEIVMEQNDVQEIKTDINSGSEMTDDLSVTLKSARDALDSVNLCLRSIDSIATTVASGVAAWKEIDKEMLSMELNFEAFNKSLDMEMDKYRSRLPLIERQLDSMNSKLDRILDTVLKMDANTEQELSFKMNMLKLVDSMLNNVSASMMKLL